MPYRRFKPSDGGVKTVHRVAVSTASAMIDIAWGPSLSETETEQRFWLLGFSGVQSSL